MIIQSANTNQGAPPTRLASDGAPGVVVAAPSNVEAQPVQAVPQQPSSEQLKIAVDGINQAMRMSNQNLEFSVDAGTKELVVKMVDTGTGELIRQIPSEETLAIARSIDEFQQRQGLLFSQKA